MADFRCQAGRREVESQHDADQRHAAAAGPRTCTAGTPPRSGRPQPTRLPPINHLLSCDVFIGTDRRQATRTSAALSGAIGEPAACISRTARCPTRAERLKSRRHAMPVVLSGATSGHAARTSRRHRGHPAPARRTRTAGRAGSRPDVISRSDHLLIGPGLGLLSGRSTAARRSPDTIGTGETRVPCTGPPPSHRCQAVEGAPVPVPPETQLRSFLSSGRCVSNRSAPGQGQGRRGCDGTIQSAQRAVR